MKIATIAAGKIPVDAGHIEDIQLASSKMTGEDRGSFQAAMALNEKSSLMEY